MVGASFTGVMSSVALAGVLFAQPDYLLLDEPTNYLDLEGALWLESYLQKYPHTVLIISHDRGLLNRAVQGILNLRLLVENLENSGKGGQGAIKDIVDAQ